MTGLPESSQCLWLQLPRDSCGGLVSSDAVWLADHMDEGQADLHHWVPQPTLARLLANGISQNPKDLKKSWLLVEKYAFQYLDYLKLMLKNARFISKAPCLLCLMGLRMCALIIHMTIFWDERLALTCYKSASLFTDGRARTLRRLWNDGCSGPEWLRNTEKTPSLEPFPDFLNSSLKPISKPDLGISKQWSERKISTYFLDFNFMALWLQWRIHFSAVALGTMNDDLWDLLAQIHSSW